MALDGVHELVGVCFSGDHGATEWARSHGDVVGFLLGRMDGGWYIVAEHISSDPGWSHTDISGHARRVDPDHTVRYAWVGWISHAELAERFPPGPPSDSDDRGAS